MFNISKLLESISGGQQKIIAEKTIIAGIIEKNTNLKIDPFNVSFLEGTITIQKLSSLEKSELLIKKTKTLEELQTNLSPKKVSDIRTR